jgi:hypothetical protein
MLLVLDNTAADLETGQHLKQVDRLHHRPSPARPESKGGVYLEFSNKDALFKAVIFRELARYTEDLLPLNKIVRKPCGKI